MTEDQVKIFPLGDSALTINFGSEISLETNKKVLKFAHFIEQNPFKGFIETVPAYSSLSIFYNVSEVRNEFSGFFTAFEAVKSFAENVLQNFFGIAVEEENRLIEISVDFNREFALDLDFVASENNLSLEKVIEIFTSKIYRVYLLGFLPGFAYMGELNEKIATPRKDSPRKKVPKGSVGIAGRQTGIYSLESPGGWQIIGRTETELFTPENKIPTFLRAGDRVKFYSAE